MTPTSIILLVLVVLVLVAAGVYLARRAGLRQRFGPEYDRAVADNEGRRPAERELRAREKRHAQLEVRPLDEAARERFGEAWRAVQSQFVFDPAGAVVAGDELVTRLAHERGYPTTDFDDQAAYLSVEHARTLGHYRDAHAIYLNGQQGGASTEELRQALVHYRELIADLLDETPESIVDSSGTAAPDDAAVTNDAEELRHA